MGDFLCSCGQEVDLLDLGNNELECPECRELYLLEDEDDDNEEALSLSEAADIYASSGCDEDCQFGYTHEELMGEIEK